MDVVDLLVLHYSFCVDFFVLDHRTATVKKPSKFLDRLVENSTFILE